MSNRIFQNVIVQLKDATDRILGVMDPEGLSSPAATRASWGRDGQSRPEGG